MSNSIKGCAQVLKVNQINHKTLFEKEAKRLLFFVRSSLKTNSTFQFSSNLFAIKTSKLDKVTCKSHAVFYSRQRTNKISATYTDISYSKAGKEMFE